MENKRIKFSGVIRNNINFLSYVSFYYDTIIILCLWPIWYCNTLLKHNIAYKFLKKIWKSKAICTPKEQSRLTPVLTRIAVEGGLTADGSLALLGSADPLRLTGRPILEGRRWLAIIAWSHHSKSKQTNKNSI